MTFAIDQLRADVAEILGVSADEIENDDNLFDLGLDSIRLMMLGQRWREAGAVVEFADLAEWPSLERWAEIISGGRTGT